MCNPGCDLLGDPTLETFSLSCTILCLCYGKELKASTLQGVCRCLQSCNTVLLLTSMPLQREQPTLCCAGLGQAHPSVLHQGVKAVWPAQQDAGRPEAPVRRRAVGEEDSAWTRQQAESAAVCFAAACLGHWRQQVIISRWSEIHAVINLVLSMPGFAAACLDHWWQQVIVMNC